jgi:hypothetical protein
VTHTSIETRVDPLSSVREALLAHAHRDAAAVLSDADAAVAASLDAARVEAAALRAEARKRGELDAAALLAGERARTARRVRQIVLAQRHAAYESLRRRARDAVSELRHDPGYRGLLDALRERATSELGPEAHLWEHERGGIVGQVQGRSVTYTLDDLADVAVDELGSDVEELWSP